jgi:HD domain
MYGRSLGRGRDLFERSACRMGISTDVQDLATCAGLFTILGRSACHQACSKRHEHSHSMNDGRCRSTRRSVSASWRTSTNTRRSRKSCVTITSELMHKGYADGLAYDEIPLVSRIIAVADACNAMTSDRPYRDAIASSMARLRLAQAVDSQLDTAVVEAFEAILASADEDYRAAESPDLKAFPSVPTTWSRTRASHPLLRSRDSRARVPLAWQLRYETACLSCRTRDAYEVSPFPR